jgi:hypothetical protein
MRRAVPYCSEEVFRRRHKHSGIGKDLGREACLANRKSKSVRIDL